MTDPERVADPMPRTLPALDSPVLATVADAIERGADPVEAASSFIRTMSHATRHPEDQQ